MAPCIIAEDFQKPKDEKVETGNPSIVRPHESGDAGYDTQVHAGVGCMIAGVSIVEGIAKLEIAESVGAPLIGSYG